MKHIQQTGSTRVSGTEHSVCMSGLTYKYSECQAILQSVLIDPVVTEYVACGTCTNYKGQTVIIYVPTDCFTVYNSLMTI